MQLETLVPILIGIVGVLVGLVGNYYNKHSYLFNLRIYNKSKNRNEKAKYYYDNYINLSPNQKVPSFLKKIDSDDLNEGVQLPSDFTDFLIKNFPDHYFYLAALLKKTWKNFDWVEVGSKTILVSKFKHFRWLKLWYSFVYFILASTGLNLAMFSDLILSKISPNYPEKIFYVLVIIGTGLILMAFSSLVKVAEISHTSTLNDYFKKVVDSDERKRDCQKYWNPNASGDQAVDQ
ncbi:hypothetical protein [Acinetobacter soli]|uniref:hypothetical protein n=1 Tax=Acinetobacter soli TaxID=487316 RepID=UPI003A8811D9